ncbi:MAG: hypothetical protein CMC97_05835 [Flavobacteriales bacterium]|nr:hypothetical protein [Flavobacteriales bacterium]
MNPRFFPLFFFTALAVASLIGCTPSPEGRASSLANVETDPMGLDSTSAQVLGVVNDLFQAMEARDSVRIRMALHPEASLTSVNLMGDAPKVGQMEGDAFASAIGKPGPAYIERMIDPIVHHDGDFAEVFTAYDFTVGDSLSHCGHDAIQLVRSEGQWRILGITYTRTACN